MTGSGLRLRQRRLGRRLHGQLRLPGNYGLLYPSGLARPFRAVPIEQGIDHHRSHGSAVADFDRDGDLDIVVGHSLSRCDANEPDDCYPTQQVRFFENVLGQGGNFVQLALQGGAPATTARPSARASPPRPPLCRLHADADVGGGHGHYGTQDDLTLHFGLGDGCEAEVTVRWPDAALTTQTFTVETGKHYTLTQGEDPKVIE
jgi:hypothetical protein